MSSITCLSAHASQHSHRYAATQDALFQRFDSNADGHVDVHEYQTALLRTFDAKDRNGNGVLDVNEAPLAGDQPISRHERQQQIADQFRMQDANDDGMLSPKELFAPPR